MVCPVLLPFISIFIAGTSANVVLTDYISLCDHPNLDPPECHDFCYSAEPYASRNFTYRVYEDGEEPELAGNKCELVASILDPPMGGRLAHIYSQAQNDCLHRWLHISKAYLYIFAWHNNFNSAFSLTQDKLNNL